MAAHPAGQLAVPHAAGAPRVAARRPADRRGRHAGGAERVLCPRARRLVRTDARHPVGVRGHCRLPAEGMDLSAAIRKIVVVTLPAAVVALVVMALGVEVWVRLHWDERRGT